MIDIILPPDMGVPCEKTIQQFFFPVIPADPSLCRLCGLINGEDDPRSNGR
jgi:hypothetical protein